MRKSKQILLIIGISILLSGCGKSSSSPYKKADLVPLNLTSPTTVHQDEIIGSKLELQVRNYGGKATAADGYFSVTFYLSSDKKWDSTDPKLLNGRVQVATPIKANALVPVTINEQMTFPTNIQPGNYHLLAYVDDAREVTESNETNNIAIKQIAIEASVSQGADLVPLNYSSPAELVVGEPVGTVLSLDVKNNGNEDAVSADGHFAVAFYLSIDNVWDASDMLLTAGRDHVSTPITPGAIITVPVNNGMYVETTTTPGNYYLIAVVDEIQEVTEFDDSNNIAVNPITIINTTSQGADLYPYNLIVPTSAEPGQLIKNEIYLEIYNQGNYDVIAADGNLATGMYLSTDQYFDSSGRHPVATPILASDWAIVSCIPGLAIPTTTPEGSYYLIAVINEGNEVG